MGSDAGAEAGPAADAGGCVDADAAAAHDAAPAPADAPEPNGLCAAPASYGDVGSITGDVLLGPSNDPSQQLLMVAPLSSAALPDRLDLELWAGLGVFAGGIRTGTFVIDGAETNYATCGLCLFVITPADDSREAGFYLATRGTVTLTAASSGAISGSVAEVLLTHVTFKPGTPISVPVGDCDTAITTASFSAVPPAPSDGGL
ncbi:MAG TPA: hypothetical protein VGQ83_06080 [Polyangia bacterium]